SGRRALRGDAVHTAGALRKGPETTPPLYGRVCVCGPGNGSASHSNYAYPGAARRDAGKQGAIFGPISRQNPQRAALQRGEQAMIIFRGLHSYISPSWYAKTEAVPTWNFAVVHASGKLNRSRTRRPARSARAAHTKSDQSTYHFNQLPE